MAWSYDDSYYELAVGICWAKRPNSELHIPITTISASVLHPGDRGQLRCSKLSKSSADYLGLIAWRTWSAWSEGAQRQHGTVEIQWRSRLGFESQLSLSP